jgi:hypothetical protein
LKTSRTKSYLDILVRIPRVKDMSRVYRSHSMYT